MRRRAPSTPLIVLALLAAACTSAPPGAHNTVTTQPSGPVFSRSATAVSAVSSLPTNFNPSAPAGGNHVAKEVMEQVWPQTFVINGKGDQTLEPGFVESAEAVSVSPLHNRVHVQPGGRVRSDGVTITAADFIYNWQQQLVYAATLPDSGIVAGYRDISQITSSKHGHTVTVAFSHPFSEWESPSSPTSFRHTSRSATARVSAFQGFDPAKVVSGGPFEITSVTPGAELVLSRNPTYWGPKPSLSHIVLKVMNASSALAGLRSGTVSVAEVPTGPADTNDLAAAAVGSIVAGSSTLPTLWQLCVNMTSPLLQPETLRLGIEDSLYLDQISADSAGLKNAGLGPDFGEVRPCR